MAEYRKNANDPRDFKERFEFRLTFGENIICQRYFRINDFNPVSLSSYELVNTIRACADLIDNDLKSKTQTYLETVIPRIFKNEDEMNEYLKDDSHKAGMRLGEGIVLREDEEHNYVWGPEDKPMPSPTQFSDGEFTKELTDEDRVEYKFAFYDNGHEVVSTVWEGVYPRYIRKSIDLSNKGPKLEGNIDLYTVGFDTYLRYKLTEGKTDLVYRIIKDICETCGGNKNQWYTTSEEYKNPEGKIINYKNKPSDRRNFKIEY